MNSWCTANASFLQLPPHPSPLPFHLHRSVFLRIPDPPTAIAYARQHMLTYLPTQPVLPLITSCLYPTRETDSQLDDPMTAFPPASPYTHDPAPLVEMFRAEFCRRQGWPKEEPLGIAVDLGSRGGTLNIIEKARKVMAEHLGRIRTWQELPVSVTSNIPLDRAKIDHSLLDGDTAAPLEAISFGFRVPGIERTGDRCQPPEDAQLRAHHRRREPQSDTQERVGLLVCLIMAECRADVCVLLVSWCV